MVNFINLIKQQCYGKHLKPQKKIILKRYQQNVIQIRQVLFFELRYYNKTRKANQEKR
ncbi:unnamed protein product [Paramecium sonneborni]|uniref:Uncharacterized protein n=1 Tax=Paramecium sonneborni TaxID=65129 RepID=A0A8S1Q9V5_9CILI|nr:unnamed protein product [Paramecium sonneborni]